MDGKKTAIVKAMSEIECYPVIMGEGEMQTYSQIPLGELSLLGAVFSSMAPAFRTVTQNISVSNGEKLYKMFIPNGLSAGEKLVEAKSGGLLGNITNSKGTITQRARFFEATPQTGSASTVMPIDPTLMLMAVALASISQKLDRIEETQKDIIEFLQLKEKASIMGNITVLQEILSEYKFNWDNEKYKNNKHIQVQEIKRDAEKSIIFCREQIEHKVCKKNFIHSDRDVRSKIEKIQNVFKDYELSMYMFSFSSFLEVMLLENFDGGYLTAITSKIEQYAEQYHELHQKCYQMIEAESKTSIQSYALRGVAGLNRALGTTISKIPKVSDGQIDENLIEAGDKVQGFNEKRTEKTMELFAHEYCTCVLPFVDNIKTINKIYNEEVELLFDSDKIYFRIADAA